MKSNNLKAALLFIDFKMAFDSIHRCKMMKILAAYGIPAELVNAIGKLYEDTRAKALSPDYFEILAGVLQGNTLAPYLFVIMVDYIMRKTIGEDGDRLGFQLSKRRSRRVGPIVITDLDFADDLALLTTEIDEAHEILTRLEKEAAKGGLHLNVPKTEMMLYNQDNIKKIKAEDGRDIKLVEDIKYLVSYVELGS